jgi:predicted phage baseplate assembly protein
MNPPIPACIDHSRRQLAIRHGANGIDYVHVDPNAESLTVGLLQPWHGIPDDLAGKDLCTDFHLQMEIDGGKAGRPAFSVSLRNDAEGYGIVDVKFAKKLRPKIDYVLTLTETSSSDDGKPGRFDPTLCRTRFRLPAPPSGTADCGPQACPPEASTSASLSDYLAKDYASFRRLMFDRLSRTLPGWTERRAADLAVTVLEVLAYAADHLSYYQDAVATEAYLDTARRRISVRRHARLVDYTMHEGCNARTWMHVEVASGWTVNVKDLKFFTEPTDPARRKGRAIISQMGQLAEEQESDRVVFEPLLRKGTRDENRQLHSSQNEIAFYTWGDSECCLPAGATSAAFAWEAKGEPTADDWQGPRVGDLLLIEEVLGPRTGLPADADPSHRHVVRLTRVEQKTDWLPVIAKSDRYDKSSVVTASELGWKQQNYLAVGWDAEDAVPFAVCIASRGYANVSVARGNMVLVDHGLSIAKETNPTYCLTDPSRPDQSTSPNQLRLTGPLDREGAAQTPCDPPSALGRAVTTAASRRATIAHFQPALRRPVTHATPFPDPTTQARTQARCLARWHAEASDQPLKKPEEKTQVTNLLATVADAVEAARGGRASTARFGQHKGLPTLPPVIDLIGPAQTDLHPDVNKAIPTLALSEQQLNLPWTSRSDLLDSGPDDRHFVLEFDDRAEPWLRFGDGHSGRRPAPVAEFQVTYRIGNGAAGNVGPEAITGVVTRDGIRRVRNPLPAIGGTDPQPIAEVKQLAPTAFKTELRRAVATEDYARLAERDTRVQRAAANLIWTGTGYEVRVAVDLKAAATQHAGDPAVEAHLIREEIEAGLNSDRRIGHTVRVVAAREVPLILAITVRIGSHVDRARAELAIRAELGSGELPGGRRGFFHPDELTFGLPIAVSQIVDRVRMVKAVTALEVTHFRRASGPPINVATTGLLAIGPLEIARLDGDPSAPEHGQLTIELEGGR